MPYRCVTAQNLATNSLLIIIVPDLVFSESKFLKRDINLLANSSNYDGRYLLDYHQNNNKTQHQRQPSISRFFQQQSHDGSKRHDDKSHAALCKHTGKKASSQQSPVVTKSAYSSVSNNYHKRNNEQHHHVPAALPQQQCNNERPCKSIAAVSVSSSNKSIGGLLEECKNVPQLAYDYSAQQKPHHQRRQGSPYFNHHRHAGIYKTDNSEVQQQKPYHQKRQDLRYYQHHHDSRYENVHSEVKQQQRVPTYSRAKTPNHGHNVSKEEEKDQPPVILIESSTEEEADEKNQRSMDPSIMNKENDHNSATSPSESSLLHYYKNDLYGLHGIQQVIEEVEEHYREEEQASFEGLLDLQIGSDVSFGNSNNVAYIYKEEHDGESLILQTPSPPQGPNSIAIDTIARKQPPYNYGNTHNDENIVNFWKYQYKRAL
jgi:hypothetical protein